ncbi:hypothetical protein [Endozoicomonas acroporae]|uniref:hypothetical protein n=1 Tax=Endozoicomonas acroporae TaxID=1701104 RepID=UPI003D796499
MFTINSHKLDVIKSNIAFISYPALNFLFIIILPITQEKYIYNGFIEAFSIGNLTLIVGGIGVGGYLLEYTKSFKKLPIVGLLTTQALYFTVLFGLSFFIASLQAALFLSLALISFYNFEVIVKGVLAKKDLVSFRCLSALLLLLAILAIFLCKLKLYELLLLRIVVAIFPIVFFLKLNWTQFKKKTSNDKINVLASVRYSISSLMTIGFYSADKIILSDILSEDHFFLYSVLSYNTIMIANRLTEQILNHSIFTYRIKLKINTFACVFILLFLSNIALNIFIYDSKLSLLSVFLFSLTAVLMSFSDHLWWELSIKKNMVKYFSSISLTLFSLYCLCMLMLDINNIDVAILPALIMFILSSASSLYIFNKQKTIE